MENDVVTSNIPYRLLEDSSEIYFESIKVNAVSPGWVDTDMAAIRSSELGIPLNQLADQIPLGKIINPDEIAKAVFFLAENNLANFTGQSLVIDGGFLS